MNLVFYLLFIGISREKSKCHLLKGDTEELYNLSKSTPQKNADIYC